MSSRQVEDDRARAIALMLAQRQEDRGITTSNNFTYKEANPVLTKIVMGQISPISPGLVLELLRHGASVCIKRPKSHNLFKKMTGENQVDVRSDVLLHAVKNLSVEIFQLLVKHADDLALGQALPVAIQHHDTAKAYVLLRAGANVSEWHQQFLASVELGPDDMLEVLLSQANGVCQQCRAKGLVLAVNVQSPKKVQILLDNGADATFDNASALRSAIQGGRDDIAISIVVRASPTIPPNQLDVAVGEAYAKGHDGIVRACVQAGARGQATDSTLVEAVKNKQLQLVDTLVQYRASLDYNEGAAMKCAVLSGSPELLQSLLRGNPSQSNLAMSMNEVMKVKDLGLACRMISLLLSNGLRGPEISEALIQSLRKDMSGHESTRLKLIKLLLWDGKADVNVHQGQALVIAAAQGRSDILDLFLHSHPSTGTLNAALGSAMTIKKVESRFEIVLMLLQAGASGSAVDGTLAQCILDGEAFLGLTSELLQYASVDSNGGLPLVNAVKSRSIKLIRQLLAVQPSQKTLTATWVEVDKIENDEVFQISAYKVLLENGGIDVSLLDWTLVNAAAKGPKGHDLCRILLQHSASPERLEGRAAINAAQKLHLETLQMLVTQIKSPHIYKACFAATISDRKTWLTPRGLEVVQYLLQFEVAGPEVDNAFCSAAEFYHQDAFDLLKDLASTDCVSRALKMACHHFENGQCSDEAGLDLVAFLLSKASAESINLAFIAILEAYAQGYASELWVDTFLSLGEADVNFQDGEPLRLSIRRNKPSLLESLVHKGASPKTMTHAFFEILTSPIEENSALALIDALLTRKAAGLLPDFKAALDNGCPPIVACIASHPRSAKLTKRLIDLGCDVDCLVSTRLYSNEGFDAEDATALAWCISQQGNNKIDSAVIEVLINAKANVHFTTTSSRCTPIILAAKRARGDIVKKLIKMEADVRVQDCYGRSSLFYAARAGNLETVKALVKAKAPVDDGSLHEASKCLHSDVVSVLVKSKHSPNFPSNREDYCGRTPLQELVYCCDGTRNTADIETTIMALVEGKADCLCQWWDRNALFLAMENLHPYPVTRALLEKVMWRHINDEANVTAIEYFEGMTNYNVYVSPTTFVKLGYLPKSKESASILELLLNTGCQDRLYAPLGAPQPEHATGLPPNIQEAEAKRKDQAEKRLIKDQEHQLKLRREWEEAENKREIDQLRLDTWRAQEQEKASLKQDQSAMSHQQQMFQYAQTMNQKHAAMKQTSDLTASAQQQAAAQKLNQQQMLHAQQSWQKSQTTYQEQEALARKNALVTAGKQQLAMQRLQEEKRMMALKQQDAKSKLQQKKQMDNEAIRHQKKTTGFKKIQHDMTMQELQAKRRNLEYRK